MSRNAAHDNAQIEGAAMTQQDDDGFEYVAEVPNAHRGGNSGTKYDWAAFPKPQPGRIPKRTYPGRYPTGIRKSIKRHIEDLRQNGTAEDDLPEFRISAVKGEDGKSVVAHAVFRTK